MLQSNFLTIQQEIKYNFNGSKSNAKTQVKKSLGGEEHGIVSPGLRRFESQSYKKSWDVEMKTSGFHVYSKSDEFQRMLPDLLKEYRSRKKSEAEDAGEAYSPDGYLTTLHVVKSMSWRGLSDEQKEEYNDMARQASKEYHNAQDR